MPLMCLNYVFAVYCCVFTLFLFQKVIAHETAQKQPCQITNKIYKVYGILNGTCNYILSEMERSKDSFSKVLRSLLIKYILLMLKN